MASVFSELYSDYRNSIKIYTEELDVTEFQFMRDFTKGMQKFQRETEYVEAVVTIQRDNTNRFRIPPGVLRIIEIRDDNGEKILEQSYLQMMRNVDRYEKGHLETPTDYVMRTTKFVDTHVNDNRNRNMPNWVVFPPWGPFPAGRGTGFTEQRLWSIWGTEIFVYPPYSGNTLTIYYIPDVDVFSSSSPQWTQWFQPGNFLIMFNNTTVNRFLVPYEDAFVKYAIMEFIRSKGSKNYLVFQQEFWSEVERAKINKPIYFREAVADYFFAPYS